MESLLSTLATQHNGKLTIGLNGSEYYRVNVLYAVLGQYGEFVAWFSDENDALTFIDLATNDCILIGIGIDNVELNGKEVFHR